MKNKSLFVKKMTALATALLILVASSFTRVEAAPPAELTSQQIEAIVEEVYNGFATFEVRRREEPPHSRERHESKGRQEAMSCVSLECRISLSYFPFWTNHSIDIQSSSFVGAET